MTQCHPSSRPVAATGFLHCPGLCPGLRSERRLWANATPERRALQNMTYHDTPHTPRPSTRPTVPTRHPDRAPAGGGISARSRRQVPRVHRRDSSLSTSLRASCADRSGRNGGRGWSRPGRRIWETMRKSAKDVSDRRAENGEFPPNTRERRQPYGEKNALDRPVCLVAGPHGGPGHIMTFHDTCKGRAPWAGQVHAACLAGLRGRSRRNFRRRSGVDEEFSGEGR